MISGTTFISAVGCWYLLNSFFPTLLSLLIQTLGLDDPRLNTFSSLWTNHTQSIILLTSSLAIILTLFSSSLISACALSLEELSTSYNLMVTDPIFWLKLVCVGFCYKQIPNAYMTRKKVYPQEWQSIQWCWWCSDKTTTSSLHLHICELPWRVKTHWALESVEFPLLGCGEYIYGTKI